MFANAVLIFKWARGSGYLHNFKSLQRALIECIKISKNLIFYLKGWNKNLCLYTFTSKNCLFIRRGWSGGTFFQHFCFLCVFALIFFHMSFAFLCHIYITRSPQFRLVCLEKPLLQAALAALNSLQGDLINLKKTDLNSLILCCVYQYRQRRDKTDQKKVFNIVF